MKALLALALFAAPMAFVPQAEAHSEYWHCARNAGSVERAHAICGTREHFDRTGRLGHGGGHGRGHGGWGRDDHRGGFGHGGFGHGHGGRGGFGRGHGRWGR